MLISDHVLDVPDPDLVRLDKADFAILQVVRDRQFSITVGRDIDAPLVFTGCHAVELVFAPAAVPPKRRSHQLAPDARSVAGAARLTMEDGDLLQQRLITQVMVVLVARCTKYSRQPAALPCRTRHCTETGEPCQRRLIEAYANGDPATAYRRWSHNKALSNLQRQMEF